VETYTDKDQPFDPANPDAIANETRVDAKAQGALVEEAKVRHKLRNLSLEALGKAGVVFTGATCATCDKRANLPWRKPQPYAPGWLCSAGHWTPYTAKPEPIHGATGFEGPSAERLTSCGVRYAKPIATTPPPAPAGAK